jgi:aminoglycoside phosphotransferase (APT) family kinase protein
VLHLDLHPANVMLAPTGPVVIDWCNAEDGPAGLDVALTAVILALVAVDPGHDLAAPARAFLSAFLQSAPGIAPVMLAAAVARRRLDPAQTTEEVDRLATAADLVAAGPGP